MAARVIDLTPRLAEPDQGSGAEAQLAQIDRDLWTFERHVREGVGIIGELAQRLERAERRIRALERQGRP